LCLYFQQQESIGPAIKKARQKYGMSSTHHSYLLLFPQVIPIKNISQKIIWTPSPEKLITKTSETEQKLTKLFKKLPMNYIHQWYHFLLRWKLWMIVQLSYHSLLQ
jgi:hypothetical protein